MSGRQLVMKTKPKCGQMQVGISYVWMTICPNDGLDSDATWRVNRSTEPLGA